MDLKEAGGMEWAGFIWRRFRMTGFLLNTEMIPWVPKNVGTFFLVARLLGSEEGSCCMC
jgi:hypothetical protein